MKFNKKEVRIWWCNNKDTTLNGFYLAGAYLPMKMALEAAGQAAASTPEVSFYLVFMNGSTLRVNPAAPLMKGRKPANVPAQVLDRKTRKPLAAPLEVRSRAPFYRTASNPLADLFKKPVQKVKEAPC